MVDSTHQHPVAERNDIHPYKVMTAGAVLIVCVLLMAFFARELTQQFRTTPPATWVRGEPKLLFSDPAALRRRFDRDVETRLHGYERDNGDPDYAHIPIDLAMQLYIDQEHAHAQR